MPRLWAMTVDFDAINVGDTLPVLIKWETAESINRYAALHGEQDEEDIEAATFLPRQTITSYVVELLSKGFPRERLDDEGSSLEVEHLNEVAANDTISMSGSVVDKRSEGGRRVVECVVAVDNDRGEPVARARAVVSL